MSAMWLLMLALQTSTGTPAIETVVAKGENLRQVAERTMGDARGVSELRALNGLPDDARAAPEGTRLKLPGPERNHARSALNAAWATVRNSAAAEARKSAEATLREAEAHFASARYDEAAQLADAAWATTSAAASSRQHFTVTVQDAGEVTELIVHEGPPVRIGAQGVSREVEAGETIRVRRGQPPPQRGTRRATGSTPVAMATPARAVAPPKPQLSAPSPLAPAASSVLKLGALEGGLGPVSVRFSAVKDADGYVVQVVGDGGRHTVRTSGTEARLPPLAAGTYRWTVRAMKDGQPGPRSGAATFTVEAAPLTLDVKGSGWQ
ncbi:MAG TPA: LysM peptidoglycan-binding domain-containing protein [Myxococcaceae bacterium]|nr:LysM peptidoglycan-binding domain-containing protein [Myxococcaceae bacterium]